MPPTKRQRKAIETQRTKRLEAMRRKKRLQKVMKGKKKLLPMSALKSLQVGLPNDLQAYNAKLQEFLQGASNAAREALERK
jgi:hypothetical protein